MQPMQVSAFKSPKKNELYLFVPQASGLDDLPKELLVMFGEPEHVIDFELSQDRKMGREDSKQVLESLHNKGYFMQMPPNEIEKISDMPPPPEHLDNIF